MAFALSHPIPLSVLLAFLTFLYLLLSDSKWRKHNEGLISVKECSFTQIVPLKLFQRMKDISPLKAFHSQSFALSQLIRIAFSKILGTLGWQTKGPYVLWYFSWHLLPFNRFIYLRLKFTSLSTWESNCSALDSHSPNTRKTDSAAASYVFTQHLRTSLMWHKDNFYGDFNRFEFRVFFHLHQLPKQI